MPRRASRNSHQLPSPSVSSGRASRDNHLRDAQATNGSLKIWDLEEACLLHEERHTHEIVAMYAGGAGAGGSGADSVILTTVAEDGAPRCGTNHVGSFGSDPSTAFTFRRIQF